MAADTARGIIRLLERKGLLSDLGDDAADTLRRVLLEVLPKTRARKRSARRKKADRRKTAKKA